MYCSHCGAQQKGDASFCHICGASLTEVPPTIASAETDDYVVTDNTRKTLFTCPQCGSIRIRKYSVRKKVTLPKKLQRREEIKEKLFGRKYGCYWWIVIGWWYILFVAWWLVPIKKLLTFSPQKTVTKTKTYICLNCEHKWSVVKTKQKY